MKPIAISVLTICGIEELPTHQKRSVTHVLSLIDPGWPELEAFRSYDRHHRTTLHFNDIIDPQPGRTMPTRDDIASILQFGEELEASARDRDGEHDGGHLLVHCHMGVSRSTAAMLSLLAQVHADENEDRLFERLRDIRPQAWPNSVMVGYADDLLGRGGRLVAALKRHYGRQVSRDPALAQWMIDLGRRREVEMAED
ncbi:protein-tyrosine-phosphatase [Pelagibius sp. 7325]|uniref:tyrosine phosphatase family protein n=1 Tax=Pelagibius sp. 7325 TaxID=3131994 RepID=UPI0030ED1D00